jgi:CHAD domain-containing protein
MKPDRLARRWDRRQDRLIADLRQWLRRCRRRGDAVPVHELRVTLRRLRLSVRVGKALFDEALVARLRTWAGGISRATSPVRDLDIAVAWLQDSQAGAAMVEEAQRLRDQTWRRHRRQVSSPPARLLAALGQARAAQRATAVGKRFHKLAGRYRDHLRERLPRFFELAEEDRHEVRRTVRWWRYLRELEAPGKKLAGDGAYRRLLPAQEALGEVQNLALVQTALERLSPSPEREELLTLLSRQQQVQLIATRRELARLRKWLR